MAIVGTIVAATANNRNTRVWNITKAADADAGPNNIAHGMGVAPMVALTQMLSAANQDEMAVSVIDATNITLVAQGVVGSAGGVPGTTVIAQVVAIRPSSLTK